MTRGKDVTTSISDIRASISLIDRAGFIDPADLVAAKAAGRRWMGRKDIACLTIGPVSFWIDATPDGKSTIGIHRQFLDRKQRADLKRLNADMVALAAAHGMTSELLAENGSAPQLDKH